MYGRSLPLPSSGQCLYQTCDPSYCSPSTILFLALRPYRHYWQYVPAACMAIHYLLPWLHVMLIERLKWWSAPFPRVAHELTNAKATSFKKDCCLYPLNPKPLISKLELQGSGGYGFRVSFSWMSYPPKLMSPTCQKQLVLRRQWCALNLFTHSWELHQEKAGVRLGCLWC